MTDPSKKSAQPTLPGLDEHISSPASPDGNSPYNTPDGPRKGPCGPDHVHASPFHRPEGARDLATSAICGLFGTGSSSSAALQRSLESRLTHLTGLCGSIEYTLTWKRLDMPSGRRSCRLRASVPRTDGTEYGGWPTPHSNASTGPGTQGRDGGPNLQTTAQLAGWATPAASDVKGSVQGETLERRRTMTRGVRLPEQVTRGIPANGSHAATANSGALNPALPRWLQGYPAAWDESAPTATPSAPK
jgi:hypothetical protein